MVKDIVRRGAHARDGLPVSVDGLAGEKQGEDGQLLSDIGKEGGCRVRLVLRTGVVEAVDMILQLRVVNAVIRAALQTQESIEVKVRRQPDLAQIQVILRFSRALR